jgi:hypothetical protein
VNTDVIIKPTYVDEDNIKPFERIFSLKYNQADIIKPIDFCTNPQAN